MKTKFFTFNQNNSGGNFHYKEQSGITHYVVVEAMDFDDATTRAETIGLYFDGVFDGRDCFCCGDRWYRPWRDEGTDEPMVYDQSVAEFKRDGFSFFKDNEKEIAVHYLDGRIEWFG